ncbi:conserved hypothetical protein [Candidatus Zixiibacteriota bacterium]|nr:conserved hypothetical protein [candidate division Zixibacteria bacterium]
MKWVTRAHVHVDRVACPWLISRFIDAQAEFIFVAEELVLEEIRKEGAIPFDIEDAELGHQEGQCSFISILKKYRIKDPAVWALAEVVNAADTDKMNENPFASGLEAIARGFSLTHPNDFENLEKQFPVYDALYAYFRLNKG